MLLTGAHALRRGDVRHPAYVVLEALWSRRFRCLASLETLVELGDVLNAENLGAFAQDFMKVSYLPYCKFVVITTRLRCEAVQVKHLLETAANGRADLIAVHEREYESFKSSPVAEALASCGGIYVSTLAEFNKILEDLGDDPDIAGTDDTDEEPSQISPIEAAVFRKANVEGRRREWANAIATKDFLSAAQAFAALLPVPELPANFDDTGWRRVSKHSATEEQDFECQIVGRTSRGSATETIRKRLNVQTTNPEDEIVRLALYEDFVDAVRALRVKLNVVS